MNNQISKCCIHQRTVSALRLPPEQTRLFLSQQEDKRDVDERHKATKDADLLKTLLNSRYDSRQHSGPNLHLIPLLYVDAANMTAASSDELKLDKITHGYTHIYI